MLGSKTVGGILPLSHSANPFSREEEGEAAAGRSGPHSLKSPGLNADSVLGPPAVAGALFSALSVPCPLLAGAFSPLNYGPLLTIVGMNGLPLTRIPSGEVPVHSDGCPSPSAMLPVLSLSHV